MIFLVSGQNLFSATVRGYVRNYEGNAPIIEALVAVESQKGEKYAAQTMTDRDGFFIIKDVPPGIYKIAGMKDCFYSNSLFDFVISDDGVYQVKIKLIENPDKNNDMSYCFMIGGIEVESMGRDIVPEEIATTRKIDSGEIDHLQASNLGDVLTLVPGVEKSGQLGLASAQTIGLRKVKRSDQSAGGFDSFGTSVILDGNEISGDAKMSGYVSGSGDQSGTDLRTIPADNIESVEVITGIASVEYGNFTDGIVKVETKKSTVNRRFKVKINPDTKGFSYNGGNKFKDESVLNYHINYSYSERDLREIGDEYQRVYGAANYSKNFMNDKLKSTANLSYTRIFDDKEPNDEYRMQNTNRGYRTSGKLNLKYKTDNKAQYHLFAGVDFKKQDEIKQKMVTDQLFLPMDTDVSSIDQSYCTVLPLFDTVYVAGTDTIDYIDSSLMVYPYNATISQKGEEWDLSFKLKRKSEFTWGNTKNKVLFGFEADYEKNTGEGVVIDSLFNYYGAESTKRSYSFNDYPSNRKFALYAEDKMSFDLFDRKMDVLVGLRYDLINPESLEISFDQGLSLFDAKQGDFFSPRFNVKYQLSDKLAFRMGAGQSVKSVSLSQIYKVPKHIAYVDTTTDLVTEKVLYQVNEELKSYTSQKAEASLDWKINDVLGASWTSYYSYTKNRPRSVTYPEGYEVNPDTINIEFTYSRYENQGWAKDYGVELTFRTKRINDLKYALNATYRFSQYGTNALTYDSDYLATPSGGTWELWYPYYVEWQSKLILDGQVSYLNQRYGLWVTMDVQYTPFYKKKKIFNSEGFESINEDGNAYVYYQGMSNWYDAEIQNYTGQWLLNLRISKSLGNNAEISLYINNFFDNRAIYISPYTGAQINLNSPIYYGLEMSVQL